MARTPLGTMASKYGHGPGDISSFHGAAQRVSCPNRPFGRWAYVGQRKNGRSGEKNLSAVLGAWAVPGGIPSGWGQFRAVKKLLSFMAGLRRQLNARGRCRSLWLVSSCSHVLRRAECVLGACRRSTGRKVTIRGWRLPDKNNTAGTRSNSTPCSFHNARPTTRLIR